MNTDVAPAAPVGGGQWWPLSVEAYHVLGEAGIIPKNTELLNGLVYKKMPKSPIHAAMIGRLMRLLAKVASEGFWVRSEQPITCGNSEPEPDVSVVVGTEENYTRAHPRTAEFVAEVCLTSHDYDRSKLPIYAAAGVKECWLVYIPEKQVEVFRAPVKGVFTERSLIEGGEVVSQSIAGLQVKLDELFRE